MNTGQSLTPVVCEDEHVWKDGILVFMRRLSSASRILAQYKIRLTGLFVTFAHLSFYVWSLDLSLPHACLKYSAPIVNCIWIPACFQNLPAQPTQDSVYEVLPKFQFFLLSLNQRVVSSKNAKLYKIKRTVNLWTPTINSQHANNQEVIER